MQQTSISPTVATTETIRDLLGLCGTVVSTYVRRDEMSHLIRWLTNPLSSPTSADAFTHRSAFHASGRTPPAEGEIQQARKQMLAELQTECAPVWDSTGEDTPGASQPTSLAAFATPDTVHVVPIPFPVEFSVALGPTASLSPLLRVFGPEYAVGLRLSDRGAHLITTFPSAYESAPDASARCTLNVSEEPPLASSRSSTLSSMRPLIRWLRAIDDEMRAFLPRRDQPVVLLGDSALCDAFATLNLHRTLLPSTRSDGSDARVSLAELSQHICQKAAAFRGSQADADLRLLRNLHAYRPERFCADDHVIATEAASRRIETLFVDENLLCERKRRPAMSPAGAETSGDGAMTRAEPVLSVKQPTGLCSRIDRTVAETIVAGGTVHTVRSTRLPLGHHIAAIFRY